MRRFVSKKRGELFKKNTKKAKILRGVLSPFFLISKVKIVKFSAKIYFRDNKFANKDELA
jgi:hypothetical protein